ADVVLAAAEGGAADRAAEALRRKAGAERARMFGPLDRLQYFNRHWLLRRRVAPRHVQPGRRALHRHRGAVPAFQVRTPAGGMGVAAALHGLLLCAHASGRAVGGSRTDLGALPGWVPEEA